MQSSFKFTKTKQKENRASYTECYLERCCMSSEDWKDTASPWLVARNTFRIILRILGWTFYVFVGLIAAWQPWSSVLGSSKQKYSGSKAMIKWLWEFYFVYSTARMDGGCITMHAVQSFVHVNAWIFTFYAIVYSVWVLLFIQGGNCSTIAHTGDRKYVSSAIKQGRGPVYTCPSNCALSKEIVLKNLIDWF